MSGRGAALLAAAALAPLLSGCIAVAALPLLAGGAMVAGGNIRIRAAMPNPAAPGGPAVAGKAERGAALAMPQAGFARGEPALFGKPVLTNLTALPAPTVLPAVVDPWQGFVRHALDAAGPARSGAARSVLLAEGGALGLPRRRECPAREPAVIVDLDPQAAAFSAADGATASPRLAENLARLREAGIVVLWITRRRAADVAMVGEALVASGLDPAGRDPLLLVRSRTDRKQVLRLEANRDVCVIAIAGDRRSDFDELFDYLRDPNSAVGAESLIGAGWFLVPPPLG